MSGSSQQLTLKKGAPGDQVWDLLCMQLASYLERGPLMWMMHLHVNEKSDYDMICFGCTKEPSHRDGSFEYPQHMFWLRNKKNNFQLRTLIWRPAQCIMWRFCLCWCFTSQSTIFQSCLDDYLGWTSSKQMIVFCLRTMQCFRRALNQRPLDPKSSTIPLSYCAPFECICAQQMYM